MLTIVLESNWPCWALHQCHKGPQHIYALTETSQGSRYYVSIHDPLVRQARQAGLDCCRPTPERVDACFRLRFRPIGRCCQRGHSCFAMVQTKKVKAPSKLYVPRWLMVVVLGVTLAAIPCLGQPPPCAVMPCLLDQRAPASECGGATPSLD
jgi:hypothetical protein